MSTRPNGSDDHFGVLLRQYRGLRGLTQAQLAERCGLNVQAISMLERGHRRAPRSSTVEYLAQALRLDAGQRAAFAAAANGAPKRRRAPNGTPASMPTDVLPPPAPLPAGSRMPLAPNPLFVGRSGELLQIAAALRGGDTVALGQVVASTGLGGLGKTQLAVELVHRYGRFFAGGVFWLSFGNAEEIPLQVAACAGPEFESRSVEERVERVRDAWQSAMPRLLVFDNCEEESLLEAWRPTSGGCRVLVTSRRSHWSPTLGIIALPLDLLPRPDSIELLRRYRSDLKADDPGVDALAAELSDLPLALHLAGSYLRVYRAEVSLHDYLVDLRRSEVVLHASLLGKGLESIPNPTHHAQSVAQTFAVCLERLDRRDEVDQLAIAVLARMACMAPGEPVPRDLLAKTLEDVDPRPRADGLRRLGAIGLVEEGDGWLRLHRLLVHFARQERLDPDAQRAVARAMVECAVDARRGHLVGSALAAVIPHLVEMAGWAGTGVDEGLTEELCTAAGMALQTAGDYSTARPWHERALVIRERAPGPENILTARSLDNLALLLWNEGDLAAARTPCERALAIRERVLQSDHPLIAESLTNLGILLRDQGELAAARPLLQRGLAIRLRMLGPDHLDTAYSLNNLGLVLQGQGELVGARPLLQRALTIIERTLGLDHPRTANALSNLAGLLREQGELVAATALHQRALDIRERVLGPEHPDTAFSLNGLARLLRSQGKLTAARPLYERALAIRERTLGPNHPRTAVSLHDLALLNRAEGDSAAARPLFERALAIREHALGPDHPDTVATRRAVAELAEEGDGPPRPN
jgi:tetratricopeptide (TPR) repeat protein/transcriptional regulator with XRE-family HTH domain